MGTAGENNNKNWFVNLARDDEESFKLIFHYYTKRLHPFVAGLVKSDAVAEEIVQDVFLKLWIHRVQVSEKDNPSSWLFTVAANQSFSFLRKMSTQRKFIEEVKGQMADPGSGRSTDLHFLSKETEHLIREAMETLPAQRKLIFRLSRFEELSHKQIAEQLGLSPNTVKNQLVSAIKTIQEFLKKAGTLLFFTLLSFFK